MDASAARTLANDWLRDLCLALKNLSLYSVQHPRGREYVDRAYESFRAALGDRKEMTLTRSGGRIYLDQLLLDRDASLASQLASDLEQRSVAGLTFHSTLTPEEHLGLMSCLIGKPERASENGGFARLLVDAGVSSVKAENERPGTGEPAAPGEMGLLNFVMQIGRGGTNPEFSVTSVLTRDPGAVARAISTAARRREPGSVPGLEAMAEVVADTLERLAELAIEEHQRDRDEILRDLGRAVVGAEPEIHPPLFLEKAGSRSTRKNLVAAVEGLSLESVADLVTIHHPRADGDYRVLGELLGRTAGWRGDRTAAVETVRRRIQSTGLSSTETEDLIDHLLWSDLPIPRRLELLHKGANLHKIDFARLKEVMVKLFASGDEKEATDLVDAYLAELSSDSLDMRRRVADNGRYILQVLEKSAKGHPVLGRIADLFFARLKVETDRDVIARLTGGVAFLADLRLRSGDLGAALDLMRKTEQMTASSDAGLKERGEALTEALSRAGNDRIFAQLAGRLLEGTDKSSLEAAEILKRGGGRAANYLIERLAEEENRSHRARLVMLLKEMGKGSSAPFVSRLRDPRWFLVRNVVGILGDIGDEAALPELKTVLSHGDPRVRREVVRTLVRLGTPECEDLIITTLADEDRGVQITAAGALATMKGRRAFGVLSAIARRAAPFEEAATDLRQEAIQGLARLGKAGAVEVLSGILERRGGLLGRGEPMELRLEAVKALGEIGSSEAVKALKDLAAKDSRQAVRDAATRALSRKAGEQVRR